ncbi:hypothetical protein D046_6945A, partial [Vibrio parahaemolyticus V-223/04]
MQIDRRKVSLR